jgi:Protein of unknown function (DUF1549)
MPEPKPIAMKPVALPRGYPTLLDELKPRVIAARAHAARAVRGKPFTISCTPVLTASMGVTINCAHCHDHKLDPISQRDYYGRWAVFAGVKRGDHELGPAPDRTRIETLRAEEKRLTDGHVLREILA